MAKKKIALFGGSFNPVHSGHIRLVENIAKAEKLDRVIVMPTNISPFKAGKNGYIADAEHRLNMCRLAFENLPYAEISTYETDKTDISFTINTIEHFKKIYPDDKLYLIVGSDGVTSFTKWKDFDKILSFCTLIAASREKDDKDELLKAAENLRKYGEVIIIDTEPFEVSSTQIREKIINCEDISCYMPDNVVRYILNNHLYTENSIK